MTSIQLLKSENVCDTMGRTADHILVSRQDLETEHRTLLSRLHQLRRLLGYPELQTGQKQRQQHGR